VPHRVVDSITVLAPLFKNREKDEVERCKLALKAGKIYKNRALVKLMSFDQNE
jgi:hypothetical protein